MSLSSLDVHGFRNLEPQQLTFPPEGVVILGPNAQGKSNLLEAIYYLETLRSFRGARDARLVRFGDDLFRLVGAVASQGSVPLVMSAAYRRSDRTKRVVVNGDPVGRMTDALGHLGAVVFSPADVDVVAGPPQERRRFLNLVLSLNRPGYVEALQRYRRALGQRNGALRAGSDPASVRAWDSQVIDAGSHVLEERIAWVAAWCRTFGEYYAAISGHAGARIRYRTSVAGEADVRAAFADALTGSQAQEARMRTTVVGPHRDDLHVNLGPEEGGIDVRAFGSGGQRRTVALALRLVEAAQIRASRGRPPTVLMDDVFAELDAQRSGRLLELIEGEAWGQVFLTAPKESDVRLRAGTLARWQIREGRIAA